MPAAIAIPLAMGIGSATAGVIGSKMQSGATEDASKLQNDYNLKALAAAQENQAWQRQQYAGYLQRMQPYNQMGQSAGTTLSNILARSPYASFGNGAGNAAPIFQQPSAMPPPIPMPTPQTGQYPQSPSLPNVQY